MIARACIPDNVYQHSVFQSCWTQRASIIWAIEDEADRIQRDDEPERHRFFRRLASKLRRCCQDPMLFEDPETGVLRARESCCKSRSCPRCGRLRAFRVASDLRHYVGMMDSPRFLTLTLRHSDAPLQDQLQHLRRSFARLRRSKEWRNHVIGGLYTVEIKRSADGRSWHPHLHALLDGTYWQQREISDCWRIASVDSDIVDIRAVHSREAAIRYLTSYIAKTSDPLLLPADHVPAWAEATHGLRMYARFGNLHRANPPEAEERIASGDLIPVGRLEPVAYAAACAVPRARSAMQEFTRLLRNQTPHPDDSEPATTESVASDLRAAVVHFDAEFCMIPSNHDPTDVPDPPPRTAIADRNQLVLSPSSA